MIYLDSGATSIYKPREVWAAAKEAAALGNPGRGGHRASVAAAKELYAARETLARHFGSGLPEGVCFFYNATTALNVVVKSVVRPGGKILVSDMEHNALRRPALSLTKKGARMLTFRGYGKNEEILSSFEKQLAQKPDLAAFLHHSNICPQTLPVKELCALAKKAGTLTLVDCAQSAGHEKIDMEDWGADALVLPSHKGLMGLQGAGALICSERMKTALERADTIFEGGSGIRSFEGGMPEFLPERLEWGTPALPAIASLRAGVSYIEKLGYERIGQKLARLSDKARKGIEGVPGLSLAGMEGEVSRFGPLLIVCRHQSGAELCRKLDERGVCLREGFHCAPGAHISIGTGDVGGVRVSFSVFNTMKEIDGFLRALKECV